MRVESDVVGVRQKEIRKQREGEEHESKIVKMRGRCEEVRLGGAVREL